MNVGRAMIRTGLLLLALALAPGLGGCGQKGDLYLPDSPPDQQQEKDDRNPDRN